MKRQVRWVAVALGILFLALLVNANVVQVVEAGSLSHNQHNSRLLLDRYATKRGPILVGDTPVATSVATPNDALKYRRTYPGGPAYAPATGFYSLVYGSTAIEHAEDEVLAGTDDRLFLRRLSDLILGRKRQGGAVELTLDNAAQQAAWQALGGRKGAVVALDPRTGAILALVSAPSYDPSLLSSHDENAIRAAWKQLQANPASPLLDRAISQTYPPGSTFKVITTAAALASGRYTAQSRLPAPDQLKLPQTTNTLQNFEGETCLSGGTITLADALRVSCNTAYGALGMQLGPAALRSMAQKFGFGDQVSIPMPVAESHFPANPSPPEVAYSAIGQFDVRVTPLQMAEVAATIANDGVLMRPYLVRSLEGPDLSTLATTSPHQVRRVVSAQVASTLNQLMQGVVTNGTGTAAQIPGVQVAGKTGTAEHGTGTVTHAWFISFAPANDPQVAVAVVVENGGQGGVTAAPIAKAVMQAVLHR